MVEGEPGVGAIGTIQLYSSTRVFEINLIETKFPPSAVSGRAESWHCAITTQCMVTAAVFLKLEEIQS